MPSLVAERGGMDREGARAGLVGAERGVRAGPPNVFGQRRKLDERDRGEGDTEWAFPGGVSTSAPVGAPRLRMESTGAPPSPSPVPEEEGRKRRKEPREEPVDPKRRCVGVPSPPPPWCCDSASAAHTLRATVSSVRCSSCACGAV